MERGRLGRGMGVMPREGGSKCVRWTLPLPGPEKEGWRWRGGAGDWGW